MESETGATLKIGIDIGGTFTDFVLYSPSTSQISTFKILSTPDNPALAVLAGLKSLNLTGPASIVHGSTVATNALLESRGARTALITTKGFKDILLIGRQNRPSLYDWAVKKPPPLIHPDLYYEVDERIDTEGRIIKPLEEQELQEIIRSLSDNKVQSVAISLLFSFLFPEHEQRIAQAIKDENRNVSMSSEILPEYREYERTSTTVVNAYVSPVLDQYLTTLSSSLKYECALQVMQSNGGMITVDEARRNGVKCILSGPAGGITGAQYLAKLALHHRESPDTNEAPLRLITFDMGGTSTDVSLIDQTPKLTNEFSIGGYPISIPVLDIHTIGAGGGSIAYVDEGGALRVGPQSAGAKPGPACYGRSNLPTVTDANIVTGRLVPEFFMGGEITLDPERSTSAINELGANIGYNPIPTALGILDIINAHMERAIRVISIERGFDPRDFTLFSFGGAGGLHAVELARSLHIPRVLISPYASVLSAFGMLTADFVKDYVQTVMLKNAPSDCELDASFTPLIDLGTSDLLSNNFDPSSILLQQFIDARYAGQSYELSVPYSPDWRQDFHNAHQQNYGYQHVNANIEVVNLKVRAIGITCPPIIPARAFSNNDPRAAFIGYREIIYPDVPIKCPIYQYDGLKPGNCIKGPAIIIRPDTTVLIGARDNALVDNYMNLMISVG